MPAVPTKVRRSEKEAAWKEWVSNWLVHESSWQ